MKRDLFRVSAEEFNSDIKEITKRNHLIKLERDNKTLLLACQSAYRKHCLSDDTIGWEELSEILLNVLCNVMGDKGYQDWLAALKQEKEKGK